MCLINSFQVCGNAVLLKKYSFVLTGYGFMLPYTRFVHLSLLDHSMPATEGMARALHGAENQVQGSDFVFS